MARVNFAKIDPFSKPDSLRNSVIHFIGEGDPFPHAIPTHRNLYQFAFAIMDRMKLSGPLKPSRNQNVSI